MKVRMGFVSNSSSGSFVVKKRKLSPSQIEAIRNVREEFQNNYCRFMTSR